MPNPDVPADPFLATARQLAEGRVLMDLEKIDFAAILVLAKPLSTIASRLAKWEHEGMISDAGALP